MTLHYCMHCYSVAALDLGEIQEHNLTPPEERQCPVCRRYGLSTVYNLEIPERV